MASAVMSTSQLRSFEGMRATTSLRPAVSAKVAVPRARRSAVVTRADGGFIGSANNVIMVACTTAMLGASRFGLAPATNKRATAGLKLVEVPSGLRSNDPAGFSVVDVLAAGAMGHVFGVGMILGLKATGFLSG